MRKERHLSHESGEKGATLSHTELKGDESVKINPTIPMRSARGFDASNPDLTLSNCDLAAIHVELNGVGEFKLFLVKPAMSMVCPSQLFFKLLLVNGAKQFECETQLPRE